VSTSRATRVLAALLVMMATACGPAATSGDDAAAPVVPSPTPGPPADGPGPVPAPEPEPGPGPGPGPEPEPELSVPSGAAPRPDWLGTRVLPLEPDGFGRRLPTPPELVDRRLRTPPPPDGSLPRAPEDGFLATESPVPEDVLRRSTWAPSCPVGVEDLRYLTVTFIGFDDLPHTGELIVHEEVAADITQVFAALHAARFPLEEVRVIAQEELGVPPTGDGNVTTAFVCRTTVGGTRWSDHAFGLAIDVNPFHNPYVRGGLVIPELASAYADRADVRPGMIVPGDPVTAAFQAIGWRWGGAWTGAATDPMHFSRSGR